MWIESAITAVTNPEQSLSLLLLLTRSNSFDGGVVRAPSKARFPHRYLAVESRGEFLLPSSAPIHCRSPAGASCLVHARCLREGPFFVLAVAQSVERRDVAPDVVGSSPIGQASRA